MVLVAEDPLGGFKDADTALAVRAGTRLRNNLLRAMALDERPELGRGVGHGDAATQRPEERLVVAGVARGHRDAGVRPGPLDQGPRSRPLPARSGEDVEVSPAREDHLVPPLRQLRERLAHRRDGCGAGSAFETQIVADLQRGVPACILELEPRHRQLRDRRYDKVAIELAPLHGLPLPIRRHAAAEGRQKDLRADLRDHGVRRREALLVEPPDHAIQVAAGTQDQDELARRAPSGEETAQRQQRGGIAGQGSVDVGDEDRDHAGPRDGASRGVYSNPGASGRHRPPRRWAETRQIGSLARSWPATFDGGSMASLRLSPATRVDYRLDDWRDGLVLWRWNGRGRWQRERKDPRFPWLEWWQPGDDGAVDAWFGAIPPWARAASLRQPCGRLTFLRLLRRMPASRPLLDDCPVLLWLAAERLAEDPEAAPRELRGLLDEPRGALLAWSLRRPVAPGVLEVVRRLRDGDRGLLATDAIRAVSSDPWLLERFASLPVVDTGAVALIAGHRRLAACPFVWTWLAAGPAPSFDERYALWCTWSRVRRLGAAVIGRPEATLRLQRCETLPEVLVLGDAWHRARRGACPDFHVLGIRPGTGSEALAAG